jgi:hypothetical protein
MAYSNVVIEKDYIFSCISSLLKKYHAEMALLFGSYARDEATGNSDIDVLVIGGKNFSPTDIFAIAEELSELTNKAVDVYELQEIDQNSEFFHSIMKEGVKVA